MASLLCCRARHSSSSVLPNSRHVNKSNEKERELPHHVPLPNGSLASSKSLEELQAIHQIFASSSPGESEPEAVGSQRHKHGRDTSPDLRIHHNESSGRLYDVTAKLRKRLSRDSGVSRRSSKRKLRSTLSEEDIERRRELKRALHQRLRDELLEDKRASEGGYDPDAEPIATPSISREPTSGSIRVSPRYLGEVLRRLESVRERNKRGHGQPEAGNNAISQTQDLLRGTENVDTATAPSREIPTGGPDVPFANRTREDRDDNLDTLDAHQPNGLSLPISEQSQRLSPGLNLERSKTVRPASRVWNSTPDAISAATPPQRSDPKNSSRNIKAPPTPGLPPLRLPSISDAVTAKDWRLSLTSGRGNRPPSVEADILRAKDKEDIVAQSARARRPLIGTSSFLGPMKSNEIVRQNRAEQLNAEDYHASHCNPSTEEDNFGGVDGDPDSPRRMSQQGAVSASDDLIQPNGHVAASSVHLYDMHIPQRLASRGLLPTMSSSQLQGYSWHQRGMSSCGSSLLFPVKARHERQTSSSGFASSKVPHPWGGVFRDNTSSVYPSQGGSLTSSPNSSVVQFPNLSDRMWQFKAFKPYNQPPVLGNSASGAMSTSATPWKPTNPSRPRRLTIDTASLHSITDSFRAREVAAAESRILPRSRSATMPKTSKFREDFEGQPSLGSLAGEGHSSAKLHHRHSIASYDGSDEWYSSGKRQGFGPEYVPTGMEHSTAIWERAFQQHAEEGGSSSKLRLGSISQEHGTGSFKTKVRGGKIRKINPSLTPVGIGFKTEGWGFESKSGGLVEDPEIDPKHVRRAENLQTSSTTSRSSWSRYPSHTRAERSSSPAGEADNVIARDFATGPQAVLRGDRKPKRGFSLLGKKKSRSMTFGKNMMKTISRLYKSRSTDFRPSTGNHRTSVNIGGVLEYPELEVLAPLSPIVLPSEEQLGVLTFSPLTPSKSNSSQQSVVRRTTRSRGRPPVARTWSKLYDDCVLIPRDTDDASLADPSSSLYPDMNSREPDAGSRRRPSSYSTANMRASTLDFQRSLQAHEIKAKERALQAAEEAWGF